MTASVSSAAAESPRSTGRSKSRPHASAASREARKAQPPATFSSTIPPAFRSSSSARKATACSTRVIPCTSVSKSKRVRRESSARNRPRNCSTGGKRSSRCASETAGGSAARVRSVAARLSGSCGASRRCGCGARGAGPKRKNLSPSASSRSASHAAASLIRRYSARRCASSSAAAAGSRSSMSTSSPASSARALSSSSAATRTRNSPHDSRSSSSRSARRSTNASTTPATSTSPRSSSSRRTSASSRSKGPSKASRSSSSSRTGTAIRRKLASVPDAALGNRHRRPLRRFHGWLTPLPPCTEELPPDEERCRQHEDNDRDPRIQPQRAVLVRRIDAQEFLEEAPERVEDHVERKESGRSEAEPAVEQEQDPCANDHVQKLVEERRMEGLGIGVLERPVLRIDLESPRPASGLAEELLVPPVAEAPDPVCQQEARRGGVHQRECALAGPARDDPADDRPEQDAAPDAEAALPDHEHALPLRIRDLRPARHHVVRARADNSGGDPPHGDSQQQVPVAALRPGPLRPAQPGDDDAHRDREQEHQPVHVDRHGAALEEPARGRRDRRNHARHSALRVSCAPSLQENLERELWGTATLEQPDRLMQIDFWAGRKPPRSAVAVAGALQLLGPPELDQLLLCVL